MLLLQHKKDLPFTFGSIPLPVSTSTTTTATATAATSSSSSAPAYNGSLVTMMAASPPDSPVGLLSQNIQGLSLHHSNSSSSSSNNSNSNNNNNNPRNDNKEIIFQFGFQPLAVRSSVSPLISLMSLDPP